MIRILFAALALAASASAAAHSFWLEPVKHDPDPGETVAVAFRVGDAGEASDWGLHWERIASLRLYGQNGVIDQLPAVRATGPGERGTARISIPAPGSYVLGFESNPSFSDLAAEPFNAYVAHEGLTAIAAHRKATGTELGNGTELYARRAKALFQVGDQQTGNVTQPIGQLLEIVPLADPFALDAGDRLTVQVLWRGAALEGASLTVTRPYADGEPLLLKTDAQGQASFELQHGSRYLVSTVWGVPAPNDPRADYLTIFASLTFPSP
jgi:hypothetical protein